MAAVSYTTHVFYPPPSIRPQIVNRKAKNHSATRFRAIHFHRLAYSDSQTSEALAAAQEDELRSFSDEAEVDPDSISPEDIRGLENGSNVSTGRARHAGRDSASQRDQMRAYRSLNGEDNKLPLEDHFLAVQTGRPVSDTEEAAHPGRSVLNVKPTSYSYKRRLLEDVVPDSTRKRPLNWPTLDNRRLTMSDSVLDTPEQTVPHRHHQYPRHLHASPSTPLNRPLRSEPVLLAGDTDPRPQSKAKASSRMDRAQTIVLDTPGQVSEEERSAAWLERLHSFKHSRMDTMRGTAVDTHISRKGESSRSRSMLSTRTQTIVATTGAGFVTSTQREDVSRSGGGFFGLGDESGMGWPEPILPRLNLSQAEASTKAPMEKSVLLASKSSSAKERTAEERSEAGAPRGFGNLPISFSTDGSRSVSQPEAGNRSQRQRDPDSMMDESASLAPDSVTRPGGNTTGLDWSNSNSNSESWEMTPTGGKRSKRFKDKAGGDTTMEGAEGSRWMATGKGGSLSQDARPTGSTESDLFSQTMNPTGTGKTGSGLLTSQSQSICTFPSYLAIPANSLTDLASLLDMPPAGESRRVDLLAVVWDVAQTERFGNKCEVQLCQPIGNGRGDDSAGWGTRKTLLRVDFWDEYAEDVKRLKSGDVVWIKNLDHKRKTEKDTAYRTRPRFVSCVSSRRPQASCPTNITIMYRAMPDRYHNRGPADRCEECAAALMIRDVVRGETRRQGEDTEAVCARHKGAIAQEDMQFRPDRRLLEGEIGMRRVKKLVEWVEATFVSRF